MATLNEFNAYWDDRNNWSDEKSDTKQFWSDLLGIYGIKNTSKKHIIQPEKPVNYQSNKNKTSNVTNNQGSAGKIDVYINMNNNVIIEQKAHGASLNAKYNRPKINNANRKVTPLEQALDYNNSFTNNNDKAQYVITCNFETIRIYDLNNQIIRTNNNDPDDAYNNDNIIPNYVISRHDLNNNTLADKAFQSIINGISIQRKQELDSRDAAEAIDILRSRFIEHDDTYDENNNYFDFYASLIFLFYLDDSGLLDNINVSNMDANHHVFRKLLEQGSLYDTDFSMTLQPLFTWLGSDESQRRDLLNSGFNSRLYTSDIQQFAYVGGVFTKYADKNTSILMPRINHEMMKELMNCYSSYNWKNVNPVLFGSMMQGLFDNVEINVKTTAKGDKKTSYKLVKTGKRRQLGIHWTPASYIHKAIDPLIINQLTDEVNNIIQACVNNNDNNNLKALQELHVELASYRFMDPAAGSGNFITETYLTMRSLENRILKCLHDCYHMRITDDDIIVKPCNYACIEIQHECENIIKLQSQIAVEQSILELNEMIPGLNMPLHAFKPDDYSMYVHIMITNALTYDWNQIMPAHVNNSSISYSYVNKDGTMITLQPDLEDVLIIGNPPFIGKRSREQSDELMNAVGKQYYDGYMDYCVAWYYKAAEYLKNTHGSMTYVSTSALIKGSQAANVWKPLFNDYKLRIKFAHQKQPWSSEANDATVSIIICSLKHDYDFTKNESCILYDAYNNCIECEHINNYLINGDDVYVERTKAPVSKILGTTNRGNGITDGGYLILNNDDEIKQAMSDKIIKQHPEYLRDYIVGNDIINSINPPRKILWLVNSTPSDRKKSTFIWNRMQSVIDFRKKSSKKHTQEIAKYPWLFDENRQASDDYLAIPHVFSENRDYMTCDYYSKDVIIGSPNYYIIDPDGFNFSIIESSMIYAWLITVGGQIGEGLRFIPTSIWNTFPMPEINNDDRTAIINAGKRILIARTNNPSILTDDEIKNISMNDLIMILKGERTSTLADLYAKGNMPPQLTKAHDELDSIIDRIIINYADDNENAYDELCKQLKTNNKNITDSIRLQYLFKAYEKMTANK